MNCCSHAEIRIVRKDDKKMGKEEASTWLWRYNFIIAAEIARVCAPSPRRLPAKHHETSDNIRRPRLISPHLISSRLKIAPRLYKVVSGSFKDIIGYSRYFKVIQGPFTVAPKVASRLTKGSLDKAG